MQGFNILWVWFLGVLNFHHSPENPGHKATAFSSSILLLGKAVTDWFSQAVSGLILLPQCRKMQNWKCEQALNKFFFHVDYLYAREKWAAQVPWVHIGQTALSGRFLSVYEGSFIKISPVDKRNLDNGLFVSHPYTQASGVI